MPGPIWATYPPQGAWPGFLQRLDEAGRDARLHPAMLAGQRLAFEVFLAAGQRHAPAVIAC